MKSQESNKIWVQSSCSGPLKLKDLWWYHLPKGSYSKHSWLKVKLHSRVKQWINTLEQTWRKQPLSKSILRKRELGKTSRTWDTCKYNSCSYCCSLQTIVCVYVCVASYNSIHSLHLGPWKDTFIFIALVHGVWWDKFSPLLSNLASCIFPYKASVCSYSGLQIWVLAWYKNKTKRGLRMERRRERIHINKDELGWEMKVMKEK